MEKSKMYELAMMAVIESQRIPTTSKVDIIRELMEKQEIERFREEHYGESDGAENAEG